MKNKLSQIEKSILWQLLKRDSVASSVAIINDEEIRKVYDPSEIKNAWENLKKNGLVDGVSNGGGFNSASAYKMAKKYFIYKFFFYKIYRYLKNTWNFLWKHFLITIILALITSIITNSLVTNYLLKIFAL